MTLDTAFADALTTAAVLITDTDTAAHAFAVACSN